MLTGSIDPIASATVTGVGTQFTTELIVGDRITVSGETRAVKAIASDTSLTVDYAFSDNANGTLVDRLPAALVVTDSRGGIGLIVGDNGNVAIGADAEVDGCKGSSAAWSNCSATLYADRISTSTSYGIGVLSDISIAPSAAASGGYGVYSAISDPASNTYDVDDLVAFNGDARLNGSGDVKKLYGASNTAQIIGSGDVTTVAAGTVSGAFHFGTGTVNTLAGQLNAVAAFTEVTCLLVLALKPLLLQASALQPCRSVRIRLLLPIRSDRSPHQSAPGR